METIAYFISSHGFGHAARACAVMIALQEINPSIQFEIYTQTPIWFFQSSLVNNFNYHPLLTDIGLIQTSPLHIDLKQTIAHLNNFFPFKPDLISTLANQIKKTQCDLVICDISPLGIAVANAAKISSVLIENFTWDWIYESYLDQVPDIAKHISFLKNSFALADYHIQTQPICQPNLVNLATQPVSRKPQRSKKEVRKKLALPQNASIVLITMGGIPVQKYPFLKQITDQQDIFFINPGSSKDIQYHTNMVLLPYHSNFYHPDLIGSSDLVLGKLGYSTLAETYWAKIPFGYITRSNFRESDILAAFAAQEMNSFAISESDFIAGEWISMLSSYLGLSSPKRNEPNGSEQIANFIISL